MAGLFSRVKNWVSLENLTNEDLNDEFNNIIDNFVPDKMDDYSASINQMRTQTDPYPASSPSQSASIAGELERLRYQLNLIIGKTYWYEDPDINLSDTNTILNDGLPFPPNRIVSGKVDANGLPKFLTPSGSAATVTLSAASTPFVYVIDGVQYTISSDVTLTSLQVAGDPTLAANQVAVNEPWFTSANTMAARIAPEHGWEIPLDTVGTNISAVDGKMVAWRYGSSGDYGLGTYGSGRSAMITGSRAYFYDSSGNFSTAGSLADNDVIQLHKLGWIFVTTSSTLAATYVAPVFSETEPASPSIGDYWYDLANSTWKTYSGVSWDAANATLIGLVVMDNSNCIRARSFEFWAPYESNKEISFQMNGSSEIQLAANEVFLNIYGVKLRFPKTKLKWTSAEIDGGGGFSNNTQYFLYVTDGGDPKLSTVPPNNRAEIGGLYHKSKPWLCVGAAYYRTTLGILAAVPIAKWLNILAVDGEDYAYGLNPNGHGSTNNKIRRFSQLDTATYTSIYLTDSSTNGASFVIKKDGLYHVNYSDSRIGSNENFGTSKNSTQLTTAVGSITYTDLLFITSSPSNLSSNGGCIAYLKRGDTLRAHTNGGADGTGNTLGMRVTRIS